MIDEDDPCPACSEVDGVSYEADDGRFRIWCALCGHSTQLYGDLDLARIEWLGSRNDMGPS